MYTTGMPQLKTVKLFTAPAQDTDRWLALVNAAMNRAVNFFDQLRNC